MDRRALLLYLQNVRDLEVAKSVLFKKKEDMINNRDLELQEKPKNVSYGNKSYPKEPSV